MYPTSDDGHVNKLSDTYQTTRQDTLTDWQTQTGGVSPESIQYVSSQVFYCCCISETWIVYNSDSKLAGIDGLPHHRQGMAGDLA